MKTIYIWDIGFFPLPVKKALYLCGGVPARAIEKVGHFVVKVLRITFKVSGPFVETSCVF